MPTAFGYRPYKNRNTLQSGLPVCTSVTYNSVGDFKPVAFGVEINGMRYRYTIKAIVSFKEKAGSFLFDCEYVDLGMIKAVRLVFDVVSCLWTVG